MFPAGCTKKPIYDKWKNSLTNGNIALAKGKIMTQHSVPFLLSYLVLSPSYLYFQILPSKNFRILFTTLSRSSSLIPLPDGRQSPRLNRSSDIPFP